MPCLAGSRPGIAAHGNATQPGATDRMTQPTPLIETRDVPPRIAFALEQAGVHPLLARLFAARGVTRADELDDALTQLLPPSTLQGSDAAARLLADAIAAKKNICIVADYDCDGATACAVALRGLALLGAAPGTLHYVVPDRTVHGYGLTPAIVDLALLKQPQLLVTVDNGIASFEGVAHARACGLDVLVTDHHLPALVDGAGRVARGQRHRQSERARRRLREQGAGRCRRDVLRAARAACRAAHARCVRGPYATPARRPARPGRAGHGGRRGQARRQQPPPGGAGPEAHPQRPDAGRHRGAVRGGRAGSRRAPPHSTSVLRWGPASTPPAGWPT